MRALRFVAISIASSTVAYAEPPPDTNSLHVSIQPAFAILSRTTMYDSFHDYLGEPAYSDGVSAMASTGVGGRIELGAARTIASNVELGAVLRLGYHVFELSFIDAAGMTYTEKLKMRPIQIGPQITIHHAGLFLRGDITLGHLPDAPINGTYTMHSDGVLGMVGIGGEVGYEVPLGPSITAQLGLGGSLTWVRSNEDGDHGEYIDRTYLVAIAATLSAVRTF